MEWFIGIGVALVAFLIGLAWGYSMGGKDMERSIREQVGYRFD